MRTTTTQIIDVNIIARDELQPGRFLGIAPSGTPHAIGMLPDMAEGPDVTMLRENLRESRSTLLAKTYGYPRHPILYLAMIFPLDPPDGKVTRFTFVEWFTSHVLAETREWIAGVLDRGGTNLHMYRSDVKGYTPSDRDKYVFATAVPGYPAQTLANVQRAADAADRLYAAISPAMRDFEAGFRDFITEHPRVSDRLHSAARD